MENSIAYTEVDEILNILEDKYVEKIPEKVRTFFKEVKNKNYEFKIDIDKPLMEQNLKRETLIILAILKLNYWCDSEEEKKDFLNELVENDKKNVEKYNPEKLFKNNEKEEPKLELEQAIVESKHENIIQRLISKIKRIFNRRKK